MLEPAARKPGLGNSAYAYVYALGRKRGFGVENLNYLAGDEAALKALRYR